MIEKRDYSPFDRTNERWPTKGDRIFSPGWDATPAHFVDERAYRLGKGYKLAGDVLVGNFLGEPRDHDNLIYPILYCYRHYIEVALKEIVESHGQWVGITLSKKDHNLPKLWSFFCKSPLRITMIPPTTRQLPFQVASKSLHRLIPAHLRSAMHETRGRVI